MPDDLKKKFIDDLRRQAGKYRERETIIPSYASPSQKDLSPLGTRNEGNVLTPDENFPAREKVLPKNGALSSDFFQSPVYEPETTTAVAESTKRPQNVLAQYKPSVAEQELNLPDGEENPYLKLLQPEVQEYIKQQPEVKGRVETPPLSTEQLDKEYVDKPDIFQTKLGRLAGSFGQGVLGVGEGIMGAGERLGLPGAWKEDQCQGCTQHQANGKKPGISGHL